MKKNSMSRKLLPVLLVGVLASCAGKDNMTSPPPDPTGSGDEEPLMYFDVVEEGGGTGLAVRLFNSVVETPDGFASKGFTRAGKDVTIPQEDWGSIMWFQLPDLNRIEGNWNLGGTTWFNIGRIDIDWATSNKNGIEVDPANNAIWINVKNADKYKSLRLIIVG